MSVQDSTQNSEQVGVPGPVPAVTLTMRKGPNAGKRHAFNRSTISIGRMDDNDLAIPDKRVSRRHVSITWEDNGFILRDLGSVNGTFLNGAPVESPTLLSDGDMVGVGEEILLAFSTVETMPGERTMASKVSYKRASGGGAPSYPKASAAGTAAPVSTPFLTTGRILVIVVVVGILAVLAWWGFQQMGPCTNDAQFVADVSLPPGSSVKTGEDFEKIWKVKNTGSCAWEDYQVFLIEKDQGARIMGEESQPVKSTKPGETINIAVKLNAPFNTGTYKQIWQLRTPAGEYFGQQLRLEIKVEEPGYIPPKTSG